MRAPLVAGGRCRMQHARRRRVPSVLPRAGSCERVRFGMNRCRRRRPSRSPDIQLLSIRASPRLPPAGHFGATLIPILGLHFRGYGDNVAFGCGLTAQSTHCSKTRGRRVGLTVRPRRRVRSHLPTYHQIPPHRQWKGRGSRDRVVDDCVTHLAGPGRRCRRGQLKPCHAARCSVSLS